MISALVYLQACSSWNRLVTRVKRLKQPKYLLGFVIGGAWFYWYFIRFLGGSSGPAKSAMTNPLNDLVVSANAIELVAALVLLVVVAGGWLLPQERAALSFSEAELNWLFSGPFSRRTLIHFKLLKAQAGIFFTTLIFALVSRRFGARGEWWTHLLGWWLVLSLLNLHFLGVSFVRTRLLDAGLTHWKRRAVIVALLAVAVGVVWFWAGDTMRVPTPEERTWRKFPGYVEAMLQSGPAPWLLYPCRLVMRPYLARDAAAFFAAAWPVLLVLGAHYVWVIRSNVGFEEASLALAQKRAQLLSAAKQGQLVPAKHKARRGPFELKASGPPAVALLWKNLIAAGSLFRTRSVVVMVIVLSVVGLAVSLGERKGGAGMVVSMLVMMALLWSVMLGPLALRYDFRSDLKSMDALKLYPLAGWRIVLGELLAPALVLTVVQWLIVGLGVLAAGAPPEVKGFGFAERLSLGTGVALVLPMLNMISFLIPNAAVLMFPAWFQSGQDATQGIEATGQRLIFALGQFVVFLVALVPAGLAATVVVLLTPAALRWTLAPPLAALPAALLLAVEAGVGILLLGKVFEKFDLSAEPQA